MSDRTPWHDYKTHGPSEDAPRSESILLIEDDDSFRDVLQIFLNDAGYRVMCATGRRAVEYFLKNSPVDLVITDMLMPEIDGTEIINATRIHQPGAAILAMSGGGSFLTAEFCLKMATRLGAGPPLTKPFALDEFLAAVKSALQY
jgi:DNA-binding NtrC family response regulator